MSITKYLYPVSNLLLVDISDYIIAMESNVANNMEVLPLPNELGMMEFTDISISSVG